MGRAFFVVGTDTEVGKTFVTGALIRAARDQGISVAGFKPAESGVEGEPSDAVDLWRAMGGEGAVPRTLCRYRYERAVAPGVAADELGERIDFEQIRRDIAGSKADLIFIEGAGGLHVPMGAGRLLAELIQLLQVPAIVVARAGLGTINHSLLTQRELRTLQIPCTGIVLNGALDSAFAHENAREIEAHGGTVLGVWPRTEAPKAHADSLLARLLAD